VAIAAAWSSPPSLGHAVNEHFDSMNVCFEPRMANTA
jgi:hypothetical protein